MSTSKTRPRVMPNGDLVYPKRGWEPPPVPDGYRRKSQDLTSPDAWVLVPDLPPCERRREEVQVADCGKAKVTYFCSEQELINSAQCLRCSDELSEDDTSV